MRKPNAEPCRHCGKVVLMKTRGLCYLCHRTPNVRRLYPTLSERSREPPRPLPEANPGPTSHPAHTEEQLAVLAARAARRLPLRHPLDRY